MKECKLKASPGPWVPIPGILHLQPYWKKENSFLKNPSFPVLQVYPQTTLLPSDSIRGLIRIAVRAHTCTVHTCMCTHMLSSEECNVLNLHSIFKTTAKVIPPMSSPTKPAFSRNTAKQNYILFHCFPIEELFERHFPILEAGFHKASHILIFFLFFPLIFGKYDHTENWLSCLLAYGRLVSSGISSVSFFSETYLVGNSPFPDPSSILEPIQKTEIQK